MNPGMYKCVAPFGVVVELGSYTTLRAATKEEYVAHNTGDAWTEITPDGVRDVYLHTDIWSGS